MSRHRSVFPGNVDFSNWWIKSKKGIVAQLTRVGLDPREQNLYGLIHSNGQVGNGSFTMERLLESGVASIRPSKESLNDEISRSTKVSGPRTIAR